MGVYPELNNLSLPELVTGFEGPPIDGDDYAFSYYSEVAWGIRQRDPDGLTFLLDQSKAADTERLRAILLVISSPPTDENAVRPILYKYLKDGHSAIRAEAIDGLAHLDDREACDAVLTLQTDPDPFVRGSVMRYMSRLFPDVAQPLLIAALRDPEYIVRENGVDELDNLNAVEALPYIEPLQHDPHPHVQQAARTAVKNLLEQQNADA